MGGRGVASHLRVGVDGRGRDIARLGMYVIGIDEMRGEGVWSCTYAIAGARIA